MFCFSPLHFKLLLLTFTASAVASLATSTAATSHWHSKGYTSTGRHSSRYLDNHSFWRHSR